jgi:hypothetical protein
MKEVLFLAIPLVGVVVVLALVGVGTALLVTRKSARRPVNAPTELKGDEGTPGAKQP